MMRQPSRSGPVTIFLTANVLASTALAQGDCAAEIAALESRAPSVRAKIESPVALTAGQTLRFVWSAGGDAFQSKSPVYVALAVPSDIRIDADPSTATKPENDDVAPDLPGVIVLPAGARAPLNLTFAADQSRLLVPLHQPGSKRAGSVSVRPLEAGTFTLAAKLIARTSCGEREIVDIFSKKITVAPGTPEIVVQDPFDLDTPRSAVVSNSGRYRLHVFEGRYRVFDLFSAAKVVDRAGHDPNFSPTSRFLAADVGDRDGRSLEVIDLVSQEVIYTAQGPFLGWVHGDAFLIDGGDRLGSLRVRPTLLSRKGAADPGSDGLSIDAPGSCNACASWSNAPLNLDLDNGIAVFLDDFTGVSTLTAEVFELATGFKACCAAPSKTAGPEGAFKESVARTHAVVPIDWSKGWRARETIGFSHIYDPLSDPNRNDPITREQDWYKAALPLREQLVRHRQLEDPSKWTLAAAAEAAPVRGDWRIKTRSAGGGDTPTSQRSLLTALSTFGIEASSPLEREAIPFSNSPASEEAKARYSEGAKKIETEVARRSQALERRLLAEVPAIRAHLGGRRKSGELPNFPSDGDLTQGKIWLGEHLEGLWRWQIDGRPIWLMQLLTIEGSGAFGSGAMLLLKGPAKGDTKSKGEVINLSKELDGLWSGDYGQTAQHTRLKPQLFFGRYLVIASVVSGTIGVYDLSAGKKVALFERVPQMDLLGEVLISGLGRHVLQINSDGQFFLHEIASGRTAVGGRSVDGEIILYTPEGYYWSSYEGAHFVQLRFPGRPGLYSFHQFSAVLNRPDLIRARLEKAEPQPPPKLAPPPQLEARLGGDPASPRVLVRAQSTSGLSHVRLYEDGQIVGDTRVSGPTFQGEVVVPISSGARWLTVLATDGAGIASTPQALRLSPSAPSTATLHGVVVGVDTYADPRLKLTFAKSDARRLANALKSGTGRYYGHVGLTTLLDGEAAPSAIVVELQKVVASAKPTDTIVFSFAGHGLKSEDGHYYLTASGFDGADIKGTGLAWSQVAAILGGARARVLVILDACHSGLTGAEGLGTNDDAVASLLSGGRAPMLVLAASKGRQLSYENKRWGGGIFTYALVQALQDDWKATDLDGNGAIEVSELYRALKSTVARETQGEQTPWLARQDLIGDFALF